MSVAKWILLITGDQKSVVVNDMHSATGTFKTCLQNRLFEEHIWLSASEKLFNNLIFHCVLPWTLTVFSIKIHI